MLVKATLGPTMNCLGCEGAGPSKRAGSLMSYVGWFAGCMTACAPVAYLITPHVDVRSKVCTPNDLTCVWSLTIFMHMFFWWAVRSCLNLYAFPQKPQLNPVVFVMRLRTWLSGCFRDPVTLFSANLVLTASCRDPDIPVLLPLPRGLLSVGLF